MAKAAKAAKAAPPTSDHVNQLGLDVVEKAMPSVTLVIRDKYDKDREGPIKIDGKLIEIQRGRAK